jgi:hypothetical protein
LALQVFPCPPKENKSVAYTLEVPTEFRDGRHVLMLGPLGTSENPASVTIRAENAGHQLYLDGDKIASGYRTEFSAAGPGLSIELDARQYRPLEGSLAVQAVGENRYLRHFAFTLPEKLSKVPEKLDVVFVLDGSRSMTEAQVSRALLAFRAYLSHTPGAQAKLLVFDRRVHEPLGDFESASQIGRELSRLAVERHNGSDVELALGTADRLLAARPAGRTRRIVLVTDTRIPQGQSPERLAVVLRTSGALLHIGVPDHSAPGLQRLDEHPWDVVTRPTGGLVWSAGLGTEYIPLETLKEPIEQWVRPTQLDMVRVVGAGTTAFEPPAVMQEGSGFERFDIDEAQVSSLGIHAALWTRPVQRVLEPSPSAARLWSALVFGSELLDGLSENEMMPLAIFGGAVSPVTSYLAIEPGVRPSTEGIERKGTSGWGSGSGSAGPTFRMGGSKPGRIRFDHQGFLQSALQGAWQTCGGRGAARVSLETTRDEVVFVNEAYGLDHPDPTADHCLAEAVWALDLPSPFSSEWDGWTLYL